MDRLGGFWSVVIFAWVWALLPLWFASGGVICIFEGIFLLMTGAPIALAWVCSLPVCLDTKGRARRCWFSVPVVCIASLVLAVTDIPMVARFCLSASALRRYAESNAPTPLHDTNEKYIGLFHVDKVWRHHRTIAFSTDSNLFDHVGVIYAPDGLPTNDLPMEVEALLFARYTHLYGPWYRFEL